MTREIKFRAWDKIDSKMVSVSHLKINRVTKDWMAYYWDEKQGLEMPLGKEKRAFFLMQFTGLKDKNGKEIYEGDIVEEKDFKRIFKIEWDEYEARWDLIMMKGDDGWVGQKRHIVDTCRMEVIGNIYENKDLLK